MAVLAEGLRNYGIPNDQENSQPGQQDSRRADEMTGIPKNLHHRLVKRGCIARASPAARESPKYFISGH